jgi:hypothetical protein
MSCTHEPELEGEPEPKGLFSAFFLKCVEEVQEWGLAMIPMLVVHLLAWFISSLLRLPEESLWREFMPLLLWLALLVLILWMPADVDDEDLCVELEDDDDDVMEPSRTHPVSTAPSSGRAPRVA